MTTEAQIKFIDETLRFNEMPDAARLWLLARRAELLSQIAANENGAA